MSELSDPAPSRLASRIEVQARDPGELRSRRYFLFFLLLLLVLAALGGGIYLFPQWPQILAPLERLLTHGNLDRLRLFILSFGLWAPLVSVLLMVAQSVILFLPAFPLFIANTVAFGLPWGVLLSWSSAVLGSLSCFAIARTLGRPVVQRMVNRRHLAAADSALRRFEKYIILLFGFVPVISFDVVSYAAGLTLLPFWEFVLLVCIAQTPSALFYSLLAHKIDEGTLNVYWGAAIAIFLFLSVGSLTLRAVLDRRKRKTIPSGAS